MPPGDVSLDARLERIESALRELVGRERGDQAALGRVEARQAVQGRMLWAMVAWVGMLTTYVLTGEVISWL
jgi:hypothetical protein